MSAEERAYWMAIVADLHGLVTLKYGVLTIAVIAEVMEVEDRKVRRWKAGERIPRGLEAVRLQRFHEEHCPKRQCRNGPSDTVIAGA